jgi:hypothetical protein
VIGFELQLPARRVWRAATRHQCQDLCLSERRFVCRSVNYDYERRLCRLFDLSRRSRPDSLVSSARRVEYMENQCVQQPDSCRFRQWNDVRLPVTDRLLHASSMTDCRKLCEHERLFQCRSLSFDSYARLCSLSTESQLGSRSNQSNQNDRSPDNGSTALTVPTAGPLLNRVGTIYAERGACERVTVQCGAEQMKLVLNFDEPFHGKVYSKANPAACSITGDGRTQLQFDIPLESSVCGTRQEVRVFYPNPTLV